MNHNYTLLGKLVSKRLQNAFFFLFVFLLCFSLHQALKALQKATATLLILVLNYSSYGGFVFEYNFNLICFTICI